MIPLGKYGKGPENKLKLKSTVVWSDWNDTKGLGTMDLIVRKVEVDNGRKFFLESQGQRPFDQIT